MITRSQQNSLTGTKNVTSSLNQTMAPGLTSSSSPSSRSTSPTRPTYSPITPTLSAVDLSNRNTNVVATGTNNAAPPPSFTHTRQASQIGIAQPPPVSIDFETNPDVLAIKSTMAVLMMQEKNAVTDMNILSSMKERALQDPEEFMRALSAGEIQSGQDPLLNPSLAIGGDINGTEEEKNRRKSWPKIPVPQNVARTPPINWAQYGIVGESLDKLHKDQVDRPSEGSPRKLGVDGSYTLAQDVNGPRREAGLGIAAPYQPGRDEIKKPGKAAGKGKGGKR